MSELTAQRLQEITGGNYLVSDLGMVERLIEAEYAPYRAKVKELREAAKVAIDALLSSYNVQCYPADGETDQDEAARSLRAALVAFENEENSDGE